MMLVPIFILQIISLALLVNINIIHCRPEASQAVADICDSGNENSCDIGKSSLKTTSVCSSINNSL